MPPIRIPSTATQEQGADIIDLSGLLDATFNGGNINNFVRVDGNGAGTDSIVQIGVTGMANFTAAGNVATLVKLPHDRQYRDTLLGRRATSGSSYLI